MGIIYNSLTPSEGLVLSLDTANRRSYPGTGNTWFDLSGNNNHGTLTNGASLNTGPGGGMNFDGVDDYIRIPISNPTLPITICGWVYPRSNTTSGTAFGLFSSTNNNPQYSIIFDGITSPDSIYASQENDGAGGQQTSIYQGYIINIWYHVCGVFRSSTNRQLYINGIGQTISTTSIASTTVDRFSIGRFDRPSTVSHLNGLVDDVKFYNRALSESEIRILFNSRRRRYGL